MRRLVKIGFFCHTLIWARCSMSALRVFRENLIFSPLSAYSLTLKANKGFLRPYNIDYNIYAK